MVLALEVAVGDGSLLWCWRQRCNTQGHHRKLQRDKTFRADFLPKNPPTKITRSWKLSSLRVCTLTLSATEKIISLETSPERARSLAGNTAVRTGLALGVGVSAGCWRSRRVVALALGGGVSVRCWHWRWVLTLALGDGVCVGCWRLRRVLALALGVGVSGGCWRWHWVVALAVGVSVGVGGWR